MIPDFQTLMLPILQCLEDGREHSLRQVIELLSNKYGLTDAERRQLLPSGRQPTFDNRVGWARTYLKNAGLLEYTRRGYFRITEEGGRLLLQRPECINTRMLRKYKSFREFKTREHETESNDKTDTKDTTPEEELGSAYSSLRRNLAAELLAQVKSSPPALFERLVVDLLLALGYGGSRVDAGRAIGRVGDEGIDGIINEDRLGLDVVHIQAKRWQHPVGRPEVQQFAGALLGKGSRKGVMITTSTFTPGAKEYVDRIDSRIILVEGDTLAELMIDNNIGISPVEVYEVKRIDYDYFNE